MTYNNSKQFDIFPNIYKNNEENSDEYFDIDSNTSNELIKEKSNESNKIKKNRRKHINSRNGCSNCKQRKIKCDETLPICSYCERRGIKCSYLTMTPFQMYQIEKDHGSKIDLIENFNNGGFNYNNYNTPINLSNDTIYNDNSIYQAHEIEGLFLPSSMTNKINLSPSSFIKNENKIDIINNNSNQIYNNLLISSPIGLSSNTKRSNRSFNINHDIIIDELEKHDKNSICVLGLLMSRDFKSLNQLLNGKNLDGILKSYFFQTLSIYSIFDKLLRKSFFLLAMDYYKNTILKQPILKMINYKFKLLISKTCENYSMKYIDEITNIIKNEYLPKFKEFSSANVNLIYGCFLILNECMNYHFKNGLKFDMSLDDGNNSINLVGIFITGFYSLVMERSKDEILMSGTNILAAHLIEKFKRILIKNYDMKIFLNFSSVIEKLTNKFNDDINYLNLKYFCNKHSKLLPLNTHPNTLIGYDIGYVIRILNSFDSIIPFDMINLSPDSSAIFKGRENDIIIYLAYYTLSYILDSIIPGMSAVITNGFEGPGWHMFDLYDIKNLVKMLKLVDDKSLKLIGIYLIRTAGFFKNQRNYYQNYSTSFSLDKILEEDEDLSINQRYLNILQLKENGIMDEINIKTLSLKKGNFIRRWNYPNTDGLKQPRNFKVTENKISNYFNNDDELIEDFFQTNNGFFSKDYDCSTDLFSDNNVAKDATFNDGFQLKILWKLATYIRINNL